MTAPTGAFRLMPRRGPEVHFLPSVLLPGGRGPGHSPFFNRLEGRIAVSSVPGGLAAALPRGWQLAAAKTLRRRGLECWTAQ